MIQSAPRFIPPCTRPRVPATFYTPPWRVLETAAGEKVSNSNFGHIEASYHHLPPGKRTTRCTLTHTLTRPHPHTHVAVAYRAGCAADPTAEATATGTATATTATATDTADPNATRIAEATATAQARCGTEGLIPLSYELDRVCQDIVAEYFDEVEGE